MDYPADRPMGHDVDFVGICLECDLLLSHNVVVRFDYVGL